MLQKKDPHVNHRVILHNGVEGFIFTRMLGNRSRYGMRLDDGSILYLRVNDISRILK